METDPCLPASFHRSHLAGEPPVPAPCEWGGRASSNMALRHHPNNFHSKSVASTKCPPNGRSKSLSSIHFVWKEPRRTLSLLFFQT